ncbi:NAC transcription factor-like protein [Medicago truncatula]|uniref:NAC transcription factor-like protein n=1 Tax=Medicago truncatula TaxID=3880 RepID=G7L2Y2_MEDTR|nr:NAC transcription factor-like protein [Medicago truncatula]
MTLNSRSNNDFTPTDDELIRSFLYNRIHNNPVPNYITILDYELFGIVKNPWEIWEEFAPSHSYCGKDLYFFTTLKKKSATSKRLIRTIGSGTWEGEDTGKGIVAKETNKVLGIKKRFRFGKSNTFHDGAWILHEYNLDKSLINNTLANNYVLCRFRKNLKINQHQSNSHLMNSIGIPRINVELDGQGKTVVPGHAENDISVIDYVA